DARIVRDLAVSQRNIEVHPHEDVLTRKIQVRNRQLVQGYFITNLMTSRRRTLKPHSLSYQANTLTIRSPSAFVSGPSTLNECGFCRKSPATSSSSVYWRIPFIGPSAAAFNAAFTVSTEAGLAVRTV